MPTKILIALLLCCFAFPAIAQDTETEPAETVIGPLTFTLPENWSALGSQDGRVIIASTDLESLANANELPPDVLITQIQLIGKNRINGLGEAPSATDILTAMTQAATAASDVPMQAITEREGTSYTFAQTEVDAPDAQARAVVFNLSDETVALATITTLTAETTALTDNEEALFTIFDSITFLVETPFFEEATRYADVPQSVSEAGFAQLGNADATVELIEFGSFDCPACAVFHAEILPELLPRIAAGELVITYVPIYGTGGIPNGDSAARAAICAIGNDGYWQLHGTLYDWQILGSFAFLYERLQAGATLIGIDTETFDMCFISDETTELLITAFEQVQALGDQFTGTPLLLINGTVVPNSLDLLNIAIDAALEQAGTE